MERPAEQLVDRGAERLALDVPERDVDRGEDRHADRARAVHAQDRAVVDLVPQVLDPVRVLADERGRERVVASVATEPRSSEALPNEQGP